MDYFRIAQKKRLSLYLIRIQELEKENKRLSDMNRDLQERLNEYESMLPRMRELEKEYLNGITQSFEAIKACKQLIAECRQANEQFRNQAEAMIAELKS